MLWHARPCCNMLASTSLPCVKPLKPISKHTASAHPPARRQSLQCHAALGPIIFAAASRVMSRPSMPLIAFVAAAAAAVLWLWRKGNRSLPALKLPVLAAEPMETPEEYKQALASTRQAVAILKAIGFMHNRDIARTMVEMRRAMQQNSIARVPLRQQTHEYQELVALYRTYLRNCEMPAPFDTLRQLQNLLGIQRPEAAKVEQEIMNSAAAFSI